jgi:hypothetical protein
MEDLLQQPVQFPIDIKNVAILHEKDGEIFTAYYQSALDKNIAYYAAIKKVKAVIEKEEKGLEYTRANIDIKAEENAVAKAEEQLKKVEKTAEQQSTYYEEQIKVSYEKIMNNPAAKKYETKKNMLEEEYEKRKKALEEWYRVEAIKVESLKEVKTTSDDQKTEKYITYLKGMKEACDNKNDTNINIARIALKAKQDILDKKKECDSSKRLYVEQEKLKILEANLAVNRVYVDKLEEKIYIEQKAYSKIREQKDERDRIRALEKKQEEIERDKEIARYQYKLLREQEDKEELDRIVNKAMEHDKIFGITRSREEILEAREKSFQHIKECQSDSEE